MFNEMVTADFEFMFIDVSLIDKFMVMVSTQYKQELNHAKKTTAWEDKKEKFNPFVMTVRTITVQEEEYKNGDVLSKYWLEWRRQRNKEVTNEEIAPELDALFKAIIQWWQRQWRKRQKQQVGSPGVIKYYGYF